NLKKKKFTKYKFIFDMCIGCSRHISNMFLTENFSSHVNMQGENLIFLLIEHNTMEINATSVIL
ncbi:unnamed protein product, partial [Musa textilis]